MGNLPQYGLDLSSNLDGTKIVQRIPWTAVSAYDDTSKHTHDYSELLFFSKGGGMHELGASNYPIHDFSIHVVNSGVAHAVKRDKDNMGFTLAFYRSVILEEDNLLTLDVLGMFNPCLSNISEGLFSEISHLAMAIQAKVSTHSRSSQAYIFNAIIELIVQYTKQQNLIANDQMKWLRRFIDYLNINRREKPRANKLATHLSISVEHLNALCHSSFGCSTEDLIARYLMEFVKRDLMFSNKSVKELAYDNGFHDPSHFIKYFKKQEGLTPGQFRNSLKN